MKRPVRDRMLAAWTRAAVIAFTLVAAGCKPFCGPLPGDPTPSDYFIQHLNGEGSFPIEVDLGSASKDVSLTFVNPNFGISWGTLSVTGSAASRATGTEDPAAPVAAGASVSRRAPTPEAITAYNQNPFGGRGRSAPSRQARQRAPAPSFDTEGSSSGGVFTNDDESPVPATCWKVVPNVGTGGGETRTLNIWVADDCWDVTAPGWRTDRIRQDMVDALADQFLKAGLFNDIYDWVTGMLGPEWGSTGYPELIPANNEITILLCDIANDNSPDGGIVGYFWSKDNYTMAYESKSSERIMFTIDAVMYANGDPGDTDGDGSAWDPTDYWPEEIFSTLAHEFQHMIHFYQRGVLQNAMVESDTWINEMASQIVEDLLSDKMKVIGPRGVDGVDGTAGTSGNSEGRLPLFNAYNNVSLSDWGHDLVSYSVTYAFGAWLARNYSGALMLHRLMKSTLTGPDSIADLVSQDTGRPESFPRLLQRWSAAQLLSDKTDAPPGYRYNTGGFVTSTVGSNDYHLGSINLFNYSPAPALYSGGIVGTSQHLSTSTALYEAAIPGTGSLSWKVDMPPGLIASVVVK